MKKFLKQVIEKVYNIYYKLVIYCCEMKKIYKRRSLWKNIKISKEERKEIHRRYGTKDYWHRYYKYFTGKFDINYFPEVLFATKMEPKLNSKKVADILSDKSLLNTLYGNVKDLYIPKTIVQNSYGRFFDNEGNAMSYEEARNKVTDYLKSNKRAIIKKTVGSCSGESVRLMTDIKQWDNEYKENYIIQEVVSNQEDLRKLNPNSLNTMRAITYICNDNYYCAPISLRMSQGKSHLDNGHAGGIFIGVKDNGELCKEAYTEDGKRFEVHPYTKIKFEGYKIKGIEKIREVVISLHKKTPQLGTISWDITINEQGNPVLVEANMFGASLWLTQPPHGKGIFEQNTEKMLKILKQK